MSIRDLNNQEVQQVAGGALPTKFVALNTSFDSLAAIGPVKRICMIPPPCSIVCMLPPPCISCMVATGPDLGGIANSVIR
jgi:hypothetical protein